MVLIALWGVRSTRLILVWVLIELNLILFIPRLTLNSDAFRGVAGLKFFFVQRIGGLLVLAFLILSSQIPRRGAATLGRFAILLKIGAFPFHHWLLSLGGHVRWESLFILLTLQKAIPLYLLANFNRRGVILIRAVRWAILSFSSLLVKQVKQIFILSSVFFLGGLVLATALGGWGWKALLFLYFSVFFSFTVFWGGEKNSSGSSPRANSQERAARWLVIILFLRGIPPFPAFFLKLEMVRRLLRQRARAWALIFLLTRGVFLYIYSSLLCWLLLERQGIKSSAKKTKLGGAVALCSLFLWALL